MATKKGPVTLVEIPPRQRQSLQPFSDAFAQALLPAISVYGNQVVGDAEIAGLARRLQRRLSATTDHPVHPALICYGLRLCCHFAFTASGRKSAVERAAAREVIDAAVGTIAKLEEYFGTYELRLLLA